MVASSSNALEFRRRKTTVAPWPRDQQVRLPHTAGKKKLGDLTKQPDGGEVSDVPRTAENENSCVVERHRVGDVGDLRGVGVRRRSSSLAD